MLIGLTSEVLGDEGTIGSTISADLKSEGMRKEGFVENESCIF